MLSLSGVLRSILHKAVGGSLIGWMTLSLPVSDAIGFYKCDFEKIFTQLQGMMHFPWWNSPKLSNSDKSSKSISRFEKQHLLANAAISFPTQISSQRKFIAVSLWLKYLYNWIEIVVNLLFLPVLITKLNWPDCWSHWLWRNLLSWLKEKKKTIKLETTESVTT